METTRYFQHAEGALHQETTRWDDVTDTDRAAFGRTIDGGEKGRVYQWVQTSTVADLHSVEPTESRARAPYIDDFGKVHEDQIAGLTYAADSDYWDLLSLPLMEGWKKITTKQFVAAAQKAEKALES